MVEEEEKKEPLKRALALGAEATRRRKREAELVVEGECERLAERKED